MLAPRLARRLLAVLLFVALAPATLLPACSDDDFGKAGSPGQDMNVTAASIDMAAAVDGDLGYDLAGRDSGRDLAGLDLSSLDLAVHD
jgi:hypothetical protein